MPPIYYLNPPPNPFWDFVANMEDHPFFAQRGPPPPPPFDEQARAQHGAAAGAAAGVANEKGNVEDPPEVDPSTIRSMPFRGRGRFEHAFDGDNAQDGEHGRHKEGRGRHGKHHGRHGKHRHRSSSPSSSSSSSSSESDRDKKWYRRGGRGKHGRDEHFGPGPWWRAGPPSGPPPFSFDHRGGPFGRHGPFGPGPEGPEGFERPPFGGPQGGSGGPKGHHGHEQGHHRGPPPFGRHPPGPPGPEGPEGHSRGPPPLDGPHPGPEGHDAHARGHGPHAFGGPRGGRGGGCGRGRHGGRGGPHGHHGPHARGGPPHGAPFGRRGPGGFPRGPGGFDVGSFLNNLGERIGIDLSSAAEGFGLDVGKTARSNDVDFEPRTDIFDTESHYTIHLSLPGAKKSDVGVDYDGENSVLRVAGVIHRPGIDEDMMSRLVIDGRKRERGVFEKNIRLGTQNDPANIDVQGITAKMIDGVLVVRVPKTEKTFERKSVNVSSSPEIINDETEDAYEHGNEKDLLFDAEDQAGDEEMHEHENSAPANAPYPSKAFMSNSSTGSGKGKAKEREAERERSATVDFEHANATTETLPRYEVQEQQPPAHDAEMSDWEKEGSEGEGEYVKINVD
ncbi:hypothetical protein LTR10_023332 [Elasticomyces elasticus]|uniref:SHSP domain-containing protein n=1 Tax=Exophiala sideris TaxID=1016849 RepID=A0ABR0IXF7_9EURO|nr:hypothetical protein LTR10_023332 [Elasticomyces elasticus]KAK5021895.1 hypothetical protein LTS07_010636 [Exophiala sideris]KAK5025959.1 hypothetical protein LTR13_010272 [Exophiala sideris]KAK5050325.1 hypothetical protein LTR69_010660 [Exophiala sideris]KAK5177071.1 hypothetical protein LTR44_010355 [Eurotiomycetes sp. CCFEE 6388]